MLKLAGSEEPATAPIVDEPTSDANFGNEPVADDKPFDDEPFDAGVEASEDSDPKKYIEQLTGKLGQSLRKYTEEQGQPDFDLEKFAINSLLSATHTSEMDEEDKKDIIEKVNTAGNDNDEDDSQDIENDVEINSDNINSDDSNNGSFDEDPMGQDDEEGLNETKTQVELDNPNLYPDGWKEMDGIFMNPKKNNMFQPNSNDILKNDLNVSENISIFGKDKILSKLQETFNQDEPMNEPMVEPEVKPDVKPAPVKEPSIAPSRKNKPFLPMPEVQPDPKANK